MVQGRQIYGQHNDVQAGRARAGVGLELVEDRAEQI